VRPEHHEAVRLTAVPKGVPSAEMSAAQREQLRALLQVFVGRIPDELAEREAAKFAGDKLRDVYFAWAGGTERGQRYYYRLQGPRRAIALTAAIALVTVWAVIAAAFFLLGQGPAAVRLRGTARHPAAALSLSLLSRTAAWRLSRCGARNGQWPAGSRHRPFSGMSLALADELGTLVEELRPRGHELRECGGRGRAEWISATPPDRLHVSVLTLGEIEQESRASAAGETSGRPLRLSAGCGTWRPGWRTGCSQ
jgi:Protein of unknown function (DUF3500)